MLESFHNFLQSIAEYLYCTLLNFLLLYAMGKVFSSCIFLEDYGTKYFIAGIGMFFYLSIYATITNFKHGWKHYTMFKFFKRFFSIIQSM